MKTLLRIASGIDRVSKMIADLVRWALLFNALLLAGNAISRKLFSVAFIAVYDLQWHFFAAVVLLMAAYTLQRDEHVRVDVLVHRFGERGVAWLDLIGMTVVLIPLSLLMIWETAAPLIASVLAGETRATRESVSDMPAWIIKSFVPVGFGLLAMQGVAEAIRCVGALKGVIHRPVHRRQLIDEAGYGD